jgi:hypothetical protein
MITHSPAWQELLFPLSDSSSLEAPEMFSGLTSEFFIYSQEWRVPGKKKLVHATNAILIVGNIADIIFLKAEETRQFQIFRAGVKETHTHTHTHTTHTHKNKKKQTTV